MQSKKNIISYNPTHGITSMKKLVDEKVDGGWQKRKKKENIASQFHH